MTELRVKKEKECERNTSRESAVLEKEPRNCDVSVECVHIKEEEWDCSKEIAGVIVEQGRNCDVSIESVRIKKKAREPNVTTIPGVNEHNRDCGINVDCVHIKEEAEWNVEESESMKGSEWLYSLTDKLACVKTEDECASECVIEKWDGASMEMVEMGLYVGHEVKQELVLGPEELQQQDVTFRLNALYTASVKQEPTPLFAHNPCETPLPSRSYKEFRLRTCFVKLQRVDNILTFNQKLSIGIHKLNTDIKIERIKMEKAYSCDTCAEQFEEKTSLLMHVKNHNVQKCINEYHSEQSQTSKHKLKRKIQAKKRLFICNYCSKQFWLRQAIATHLRTHTGEKPFKCKICDKKFTDLSTLIRHKRVHTGEKPYSCDTCNKSFSEKYLLRNHQRIHTGEIRYSCKLCKKPFNHISNLSRHERSHTEKPFECDFCGKRFNLDTRLNKHMLMHMQKKPYKCGGCEKSFKQSSHLQRHLKGHVDKPYLCEVCKARFSQRSTLQRHERRKVCGKALARARSC